VPIAASPTAGKIRDWIARYAPAEAAGITCALAAAYGARHLTTNVLVSGYAGAWGEAIGYGAVIIIRDFIRYGKRRRPATKLSAALSGLGPADVFHVTRNLLSEFGPATVLDTFVTRPLAMSIGMRALGPIRGLIAGKLAADVVFYIPVIIMYERSKRR
jgi:hypothetical protein